jgi:hypothetical protein
MMAKHPPETMTINAAKHPRIRGHHAHSSQNCQRAETGATPMARRPPEKDHYGKASIMRVITRSVVERGDRSDEVAKHPPKKQHGGKASTTDDNQRSKRLQVHQPPAGQTKVKSRMRSTRRHRTVRANFGERRGGNKRVHQRSLQEGDDIRGRQLCCEEHLNGTFVPNLLQQPPTANKAKWRRLQRR